MATTLSPKIETLTGAVSAVRWRRISPAIFAVWFVGLLDKFAVGIIVTTRPFLMEMSLTNKFAAIGLLTSVVVFAQAVGTFFFGWATDRWGPRRCAILGESARVVATAAFALAPNLLVLLLARTLLGLGEGHCYPVANSLTARWFSMKERAQGKALWLSAQCIGPGVSGFFVGSLLQVTSWRGAFWVLTAISAAIFVLVVLFLQDDPARDSRVSPAELRIIQTKTQIDAKAEKGTGSKLGTADYWIAVIVAMGISVGVWAWAAWLPSYFARVKHLNLHMTKDYLLLAYFVALVVNLLMGRFIDRIRKRGVWGVASFWLCALMILIVGFVPSSPGILMLVLVVALSYGVSQPVSQSFVDRICLPKHIGRETGVLNGIGNIIAAVGPTFMGFLIGVAQGGYQYAFLYLVIICFISGSAAFVLMRRGY